MTEEDIQHQCPNCDFAYPQEFAYCPHCGQKNEASVLSFRSMIFDLLGAFFSFDTKAIRSVPKLLFMPGSLTTEYVRGKRETYLAPFRLYLFISIVLFLLLPFFINDDSLFATQPNIVSNEEVSDSTQVDSSLAETGGVNAFLDQVAEEMEHDFENSGDSSLQATDVDSIIRRFVPKKGINFTVSRDPDKPNISLVNFGEDDTTAENRWNKAVTMVEEGTPIEAAIDSLFPNSSRVTRFSLIQGMKLQSRGGKGIVSSFLDVTSYTLFIFLPVFALCLKLLYIRRKRFYIEHLIFSLHFFSFFFLTLILFLLLYRFIYHVPVWIFFVISLFYLLVAMRRVYQQSWWKTSFKWLILLFTTSSFFLPVFFIIAVAISILFY